MRTISLLGGLCRGVVLALGVSLLAGTAQADIKSFNAAMAAKNYKQATAEAASTWPTLDKSRDDLAIIAREFGFAAYLADDFGAAKAFGDAAVSASSALGEAPVLRASSEVLLRLAEHRLAPTPGNRDVLYAAIEARASDPTLDLISFFATDIVTAYDFEHGDWQKAAVSGGLGKRLTQHGGPEFTKLHYRFALYEASASYLGSQNLEGYVAIANLSRRVVAAIAAAPTDADVDVLIPLYYEVDAWEATARNHLTEEKNFRNWSAFDANAAAYVETDTFKTGMARIRKDHTPKACRVTLSQRSKTPDIPTDQRFRNMIGTIIVSMDIGENGKSSNPRLLGAVPSQKFAQAVIKGLPAMTFTRAKDAEAGCSLAQRNYIFTMIFRIN